MKTRFTISLYIASLIAVGVTSASLASAQVTFSDGTFNNADWSLSTFTTGTGSATQSQILIGGNPGSYLSVVNTSHNDYILAYSYMNAAKYNPQTQGAIANITESFDNIQPSGGQGVAPAVQQNGIDYFAAAYDITYPPSWTTFSWNALQANAFITFSDPNAHPDFSNSGSVITFGIFNANSPVGERVTTSGFDNFRVTVQTTPEPGAAVFLLVGMGLTGVSFALRRRR